MLEARNRIGGRIFTQHDPVCDPPVELGAEFIHGQPLEIWERLDKFQIEEVEGKSWCASSGGLAPCDFFLPRLLGVENLEDRLEAAYVHDWQSDPFSRGAYSYAKVGAGGAQARLAAPVENTLFFAGEATDTSGYNGTVHGAVASGYRAAEEIVRARGEHIPGYRVVKLNPIRFAQRRLHYSI